MVQSRGKPQDFFRHVGLTMSTTNSSKIFTGIVTDIQGSAWTTLRFFLGSRWKLYGIISLISLCVSFFETLNLAVIFPLFSSLLKTSGQDSAAEPALAWIYRAIDLVPINDKVLAASAVLVLFSILKFGFSLAAEYLNAYASGLTLHDARKALLEKYYRFPYTFFLDHKQGDLKHVVLMSAQRVSYCLWILTQAVTEALKIAAILGLLMFVNVGIALGLIAAAAVFYFGVAVVFQKASYRHGKLFGVRQMEMTNLTDEMLTGARSIMVFGAFPFWLRRFLATSLAQMEHQIKQRIVLNVPKNILETGIVVGFLSVVVALHWMNPGQTVELIPMAGVVGMSVMKLWPSLHQVNRARLDLTNQMAEVELVYRVLAGSYAEGRTGGAVFSGFEHGVEFKDVSFAFPNRTPVLNHLSFCIEKDKVTAIVGRSGEGKTTLINVLLGLYDPQEGSVSIDGRDLRSYKLEDWRARIGLVPQDPFLFHGTIAENISFGETATPRQIVEAARVALVDEFVQKLPQGYDTIVGDRGLNLSGGQQQRLAIARAILRNPALLVFDEATSSLDSVSERLVQEAIAHTSKNRTVLLIAHRLSTIQYADKIVVLEKGSCVEQGTHEELSKANGVYSRMVHATAEPAGLTG